MALPAETPDGVSYPIHASARAHPPAPGGKMSHHPRHFLAAAIAVLISTLPILAQSTFGSITGTVKDPSGSVVPGAVVEVVNEGTGTTRESVSSSAGVFNV